MTDSRAGNNRDRQDQPQERGKFKFWGEQARPKKSDPSDKARKEYKDLGVPQKSKPKTFDVIRNLFHTPLVPPDVQAKANDAQAKVQAEAEAEAEAEARKEGLGNSLSQLPEITQKHERRKQVRLYEILAQSLVEDIKERGKLERGIAKASRQELSLKNRREEDPKLQGRKKLAQRGLLQVREWWSSIKRASLEREIRDKTKDINDMLDKINGAEETARTSLTLQDGSLKLEMKERVPYSTDSGLNYGSDDFEMPRFSHLNLDNIKHDLRSQKRSATGINIRARLKEFRDYYVALSILQKTEQGYRAQEGICLAKSHKLRFEIQDLVKQLVDMRKQKDTYNTDLHDAEPYDSEPHDSEPHDSDPHDSDLHDSDLHKNHLKAFDHHIGAIKKDIQSKYDELVNLEQKNLKSIQSHITKIQEVYKLLERHHCHSLMERLINLEKQHPSDSSGTDEITVTWGAAIPKQYQFVHPVKRHLEKALPIPGKTRSGTDRRRKKSTKDIEDRDDDDKSRRDYDLYSVRNREKAPDRSKDRNEHALTSPNIHGFEGETSHDITSYAYDDPPPPSVLRSSDRRRKSISDVSDDPPHTSPKDP